MDNHFLRCERNQEAFEQNHVYGMLLKGEIRTPRSTKEQKTCSGCQAPLKTVKTLSQTYGEITLIPDECEKCVDVAYEARKLQLAKEDYQAGTRKCCGYQNKPVAHDNGFVMLIDAKDGYGFQDEVIEHMLGVLAKTEERSLYIYGMPGTGKTFLAKALNNELVKALVPVCFIRAVDLAITLRKETFGDQYKEVLAQFSKVPVLIIDDLGTQKNTEWVSETIFSILDSRYTNRLKTIITSNIAPSEHGKDQIRLTSRLSDTKWMRTVYLRGKDIRLDSARQNQHGYNYLN